jgi:hypothetical protein
MKTSTVVEPDLTNLSEAVMVGILEIYRMDTIIEYLVTTYDEWQAAKDSVEIEQLKGLISSKDFTLTDELIEDSIKEIDSEILLDPSIEIDKILLEV